MLLKHLNMTNLYIEWSLIIIAIKNINRNENSDICNCNEENYSKYVDEHRGNIIKGDINIVENVNLKKPCIMEQNTD